MGALMDIRTHVEPVSAFPGLQHMHQRQSNGSSQISVVSELLWMIASKRSGDAKRPFSAFPIAEKLIDPVDRLP